MDVLPDVGPDEKTDWVQTFQPVYPFAVGDGWKLVTYSIIPVVSQPSLAPGDSRTNGLGDSAFFGYFVPPNEDGALRAATDRLQRIVAPLTAAVQAVLIQPPA